MCCYDLHSGYADILKSVKEFLEGGGGPGRDDFVRKELRAYLQRRFSRIDSDDIGQQSEIIDVAGSGREGFHGEVMLPLPATPDDRTPGACPDHPCPKYNGKREGPPGQGSRRGVADVFGRVFPGALRV